MKLILRKKTHPSKFARVGFVYVFVSDLSLIV